ncbi:hypothetical protein R1sor_018230 [Riccia sorocarpa]|uniref:Uncharacterized protein n=1 Tax=Riccia sorocarpa TaxID=122646 RepID=A0ABD3I936_9MARC
MKQLTKIFAEEEEEWIWAADALIRSVNTRSTTARMRKDWSLQEILLLGCPVWIPGAPTVSGLLAGWKDMLEKLQLSKRTPIDPKLEVNKMLALAERQKWITEDESNKRQTQPEMDTTEVGQKMRKEIKKALALTFSHQGEDLDLDDFSTRPAHSREIEEVGQGKRTLSKVAALQAIFMLRVRAEGLKDGVKAHAKIVNAVGELEYIFDLTNELDPDTPEQHTTQLREKTPDETTKDTRATHSLSRCILRSESGHGGGEHREDGGESESQRGSVNGGTRDRQ